MNCSTAPCNAPKQERKPVTPRETVLLTRYVKALCPAQAIDEYTPDVWHDVLSRAPWLTLEDARAAAVDLKLSGKPFIDVAEIVAEARRAHRKQAERERSDRILAPARQRREQLEDPRLMREDIEAIFAAYGRPELTTGR